MLYRIGYMIFLSCQARIFTNQRMFAGRLVARPGGQIQVFDSNRHGDKDASHFSQQAGSRA